MRDRGWMNDVAGRTYAHHVRDRVFASGQLCSARERGDRRTK